jgi:hypothetical protein
VNESTEEDRKEKKEKKRKKKGMQSGGRSVRVYLDERE